MTKIGVILAGGTGERMGGKDKGVVLLAGRRLIDHVYDHIAPQVDHVLISGSNDYGLGIEVIPDRKDGPAGPAAGLWSVCKWMEQNTTDTKGFITLPVDAPFFSTTCLEKLVDENLCVVACSNGKRHPTFAFWQVQSLTNALKKIKSGEGVPLNKLADMCNAREVVLPEEALTNINTPKDLALAEKRIRKGSGDA